MTTKTISITEGAYNKLATLKLPEESFSEEVNRLTSHKNDIKELLGAWSDISSNEKKEINEAIKKRREYTRHRR